MKLLSKWMLIVAAAWLFGATLALIRGELVWAGIFALISVGALDVYRRDKRKLG
jgi:hypothetical protein